METGKLELIIGGMFSGKSTELIRRINKEKSINKKLLVINYAEDNRYSKDSVITHDSVKVKCLKLLKLGEVMQLYNQYESIFIDEAQFFPDLYDIVKILVDTHKKHVVIAGLDGDSNRKEFGDILKLIPISDSVDKLTAYCSKCNNGTIALFSKKIIDNGVKIDIGNNYIPVCRNHYLN